MKSRFSVLILCLGTLLHVSAQNSQTSLDSALVACYPFSGNANDNSGNNMNGAVNGAVLTTDRFGAQNSAYYFNGKNGNTNILVPGFSSVLNGSGVSISFWTYKNSYETRAAFLMVGDDIYNRLCACVYYGNQASNSEIYWDCGDIYNSGRMNVTPCVLSSTNSWDHWVFVQSTTGNYMKVYRNGSLVSTKTTASSFLAVSGRSLSIGGGYDVYNGNLWFDGKLDDIRIYKRLLLPGEVTALYNSTLACSSCSAVPSPSNTTLNNNFCVGSSATLTAAGSSTLNWYSSPGSTLNLGSGPAFVIPNLNTAGSFSYYVRSSSTCSTSAAVAVQFTVNPLPNIVASANTTTVCSGQSLHLFAGGGTNYTWSPGSSFSTTYVVSPSNSTTYTLTGTDGKCESSDVISVNVLPLPQITINTSSLSICSGQAVQLTALGAATYSWSNGSVFSIINVSPTQTTTYTVTGTDQQTGCTNSTSFTQLVLICTGMELQAKNPVRIYPNPTSGPLSLELGSPADVTIYNLLGEKVFQKEVNRFCELDISSYPSGIYLMSIGADGQKSIYRLVKK